MILKYFILFTLLISTIGCKKTPPDGDYCAKVSFVKAGNKRLTSYDIIVEVKKNQLVDILFPIDHQDSSSIKPVNIPENGKFTAVSQSGVAYKIEMKGAPEKCLQTSRKKKNENPLKTKKVQCKGKNKDGKRCQRLTDNKSGFCWQH